MSLAHCVGHWSLQDVTILLQREDKKGKTPLLESLECGVSFGGEASRPLDFTRTTRERVRPIIEGGEFRR